MIRLSLLHVVLLLLLWGGEGICQDQAPGEIPEPAEKAPVPKQKIDLNPESLSPVVSQLGADAFKERIAAQRSLMDATGSAKPEVALDLLAPFFFETDDLEVKHRLESLIWDLLERSNGGEKPPGFLGISMTDSQFRLDGKIIITVLVNMVVPDSAAEKAEMKAMDQIVQVDDKTFKKFGVAMQEFRDYIASKSAGDIVTIKLRRRNEAKEMKITLGERPNHLIPPDPDLIKGRFTEWQKRQRARLGLPAAESPEAEEEGEPDAPGDE